MTQLEWIVAMVSAVLGGGLGAYATYVRSRGQNKVDYEALQIDRTFKFQDRVTAQLAAAETRIATLEHRNDSLFAQNQEHISNVAVLTEQNKQLTREITELRDTMKHMRDESQERAKKISFLEKDVAEAIQKYQIEVAKNQYLEKENDDQRRELDRLHAKLPSRLESDGQA